MLKCPPPPKSAARPSSKSGTVEVGMLRTGSVRFPCGDRANHEAVNLRDPYGSYIYIYMYIYIYIYITKGSVSYLSSPCFSTSLGGIGGPARAIHGILAVMYWISIIRGGGPPPPKMVMGSIPTGDAVTGPHIRGTLSMREMSL